MRRLLPLLLVLGCAHAQRSADPTAWLELETQHFTLRTDLPEDQARQNIENMEKVRAGLFSAGWHAAKDLSVRTIVVQVASKDELLEFAKKGIDGFATTDRFHQPLIVIHGGDDVLDQELFKHELTHTINAGFLTSRPRWVDEGLACYLETLDFKRGGAEVVLGEPERMRLDYLRYKTNWRWFAAISTGAEMLQETAETGWADETAAWALVHYFLDMKPKAFAHYLDALANGTEPWRAFSDAFPGLRESDLSAAMAAYLEKGAYKTQRRSVRGWSGPVAVRSLPPAEVYALRADLLRMSPGYGLRRELVSAEVAKALRIDPGNPYALMLEEKSDAKAATTAHAGDWRSWVLAYDRDEKDHAAIERAAELAPDQPMVLSRLTFVELSKKDDVPKALVHATHALELAPGRSDVLDAVAHAYAANGHCDKALAFEQRAIEARPDAGVTYVSQEMLNRKQRLAEYCDDQREASAAAPGPQVRETAVVADEVKVKACKKPVPHLIFNQELRIEFTLGKDGSPQNVVVKGEAPKKVASALQRYFESCSYEPFLVDGKPQAAEATFVVSPPSKKKK